jgi:hypothetical protein
MHMMISSTGHRTIASGGEHQGLSYSKVYEVLQREVAIISCGASRSFPVYGPALAKPLYMIWNFPAERALACESHL